MSISPTPSTSRKSNLSKKGVLKILPLAPTILRQAAQIQEVHAAEQELYESSRIQIINKFQETLSDDLNPNPMEIPGKSMHIYLQPNAVPNSISIAKLVPLCMQRAANQVISDLLKKQVITKVNKYICLPRHGLHQTQTNLSRDQFTHSH